MNESESQYKQFLYFQEFIKKQQISNQTCVDNNPSEPINTSSKLSAYKVPKKRKISLHTHVLIEWVTKDPEDLTILPINMVLGLGPEKQIENSVYNNIKFTGKSNGGVYKVLAIGTREECSNIQEIKIKSHRTQKESIFLNKLNKLDNPVNNTDATIKALSVQVIEQKEKIIELQAIIDSKNNDLDEATRMTKETVTKYDLLMNSFSKLKYFYLNFQSMSVRTS